MNKLNAMLIDALNDEWKANFQYQIHASQLRGLYREGIADHMKEHADDEQDHADRLSIHLFGKGVAFEVVVPEIRSSLDVIEMITQDLEEEIIAIDKYAAILEVIGDDPELADTKVLIEDITTDEVGHQDENAAFIRAKISARTDSDGDMPKVNLEKVPDDVMARALNAFVKLADQSDRLAVITGSRAFAKRADTFSGWAAGFVRRG